MNTLSLFYQVWFPYFKAIFFIKVVLFQLSMTVDRSYLVDNTFKNLSKAHDSRNFSNNEIKKYRTLVSTNQTYSFYILIATIISAHIICFHMLINYEYVKWLSLTFYIDFTSTILYSLQ